MKKRLFLFLGFLLSLGIIACNNTKASDTGIKTANSTSTSVSTDFKVVGYTSAHRTDPEKIPYEYLTHINYAFGIPDKEANGKLQPIPQPERLKALVQKAHENEVEVFLAVGGWNIGDGGGIDTRFEKLADSPETRTAFVQSLMEVVQEFNLDGIDMDWEYPDPIQPSSDNYVKLMGELKVSLAEQGKKLTAAVVAYHDRYGYGIKDEIFEIVDWLNLMAYDDDHSSFGGQNVPHSPYWLAVRSFDYWIDDRGLPKEKAVMGVPFYGKRKGRFFDYKKILEMGADPYADELDSIYYNGIKTIKEKTRLSKERSAGIMIWEIPLDTDDDHSLLKAINEEAGR